mmetsp:Transcript_23181/g.20563  ORF Transcript_23181/g.20563 Transcript_23181/m.20563 type:complete len:134 (+) Transcript_23181:86-487(+)
MGNNSHKILNILIHQLGDYGQAIEYVSTKEVHDAELWDVLYQQAQKDSNNLATLLRYMEYYSKPENLILNIPDGSILKDYKQPLIEAFQQIKLQLGILKNFEMLTTNEVLLAMDGQIKYALAGATIDVEICKY